MEKQVVILVSVSVISTVIASVILNYMGIVTQAKLLKELEQNRP